MRNIYRILVRTPKGKRPYRIPCSMWEDSIRMNLRELGWEGVNWMHLAQGRDQWRYLVNMVMNLQVL